MCLCFLTKAVALLGETGLASLAIILTAVILYPLVMFALGWLYGIVVSFIFNVVIGVSGGVGLTVEEERVTKK